MFESILVPTDFEEPAKRALDLAIELGRKTGARLTLLHVYEIPRFFYTEPLQWPVESLQAAADKALNELLVETKTRYPNTSARMESGSPWETIAACAGSGRFDLIVIGTHGRRGLERALLGSVAEKVVRISPVPVLSVGGPAQPAAT